MSAGVVLGAVVAVLGLYLSQSRADEWAPANVGPDKTVTISERELKNLMQRLSDLELRVKALEYNGIVLLGPSAKNAIRPQMTFPEAHPQLIVPETWPNDGFGPMRTIPADSHSR